MCYRISDMGLCSVEKGHTYTLDEFRNAQFEQLEEVCTLNCHWFVAYVQVHLLLGQFRSSRQSGVMEFCMLYPFIFQRYHEFFDFYLPVVCMFPPAGCWKTGRVPWPCKRSCKKCMSDSIIRGRVYPWWLFYGYRQSHGHVCRYVCHCTTYNARELLFNQKFH